MAEKIKVLIPEKEVNARIEELGKTVKYKPLKDYPSAALLL